MNIPAHKKPFSENSGKCIARISLNIFDFVFPCVFHQIKTPDWLIYQLFKRHNLAVGQQLDWFSRNAFAF